VRELAGDDIVSGLVLAQVVDPVTAQRIVGIITGMGGDLPFSPQCRDIFFTLF
jgi:hypothetical protein